MIASWYDEQGAAGDVLRVGELPDPRPGAGEVRVRVRVSGVNPGDTKKRLGWLGSSMPYPRVVPHSDAAGVIDMTGAGVDARRVGERVWVYGAQSYRPFGTAAQYTVVPADLAVRLPDHVGEEVGAGLGIPGITAHRAVFADGPVDGSLVLVHGVLGGVGSMAAQLAHWAGATVLATVRRTADLGLVDPAVVSHAVALDTDDPAGAIRSYAPQGVDRVIEVSLSDNADLDNAVTAVGAVVAAYATRTDRTGIPFWPMLFNNVTLRLLGSDDFPAGAKRQAARDLTSAAAVGALTVDVGDRYPLQMIADAHDRVDAGGRGRVLVHVPD
ncbi:NADPH:quinone reductase [Streptomyces poriferorum]|uniref:NADPH:quinone reductase n=1 Tax=Streptomyces poriferorum TaxID=2798799 RepID=A0ABY9IJD2_9ACTN|nr:MULTISPECIES: NADPH:quinone reductase [unclassified Streptomyces]MDP5316929.1 NADPH:quinone reductase [Streptomyces sp. Alt4]WLQ55210.1 NADPH:quinone reductase [Streptomyces sp. Alt2]